MPAPVELSREAEWNEIVAELTRRRLLERGLGLGVATVLGADLSAAYAAESTRTIATAMGSVRIPSRPARVVTVDWYTLPIMLDVGYHPVGVPTQLGDGLLPGYQHLYAGLDKVGSVSQPSLERVAALRPDLIIGLDQFNKPLYDKLRGIAPTALFRWQSSGDWTAVAASVTGAVGRAAAERTLKERYLARAAAIRTRHAAVLARTRFAIATGGMYNGKAVAYLWHSNSDTGDVLVAAGARLAKASAGKVAGGVGGVSFEQLDRLADADAILVEGAPGGGVGTYSKPLVGQPTFTRLPAVEAGHVFPLAQIFPTSCRQALTLLDEFERVLSDL